MPCRGVFFAVSVWLLGLSGCSSDPTETEAPPPSEGEWLGQLATSDAMLAIRVDGEHVAAYVCGGAMTLETHTRWWTGATKTELSLEQDNWIFSATLADGDIDGELTSSGGDVEPFVLTQRPESAAAGLFTVFDSGCQTGVIVLDGGDAQGAWCDAEGNFGQVTPVMPVSRDGFEVVASTPTGDVNLFVELAEPSAITP